MDLDHFQVDAHDGRTPVDSVALAARLLATATRLWPHLRTFFAHQTPPGPQAGARAAAIRELGDLLHTVSELAGGLGVSLTEVARQTLVRLHQERGADHGRDSRAPRR